MYTDEYLDNTAENYDEEEKVEVKTSNSSNNSKLFFVLILIVVLVGGIAYILLNRKTGESKDNNYTISVYPENLIVPFGETKSISYEVRNSSGIIPDATIRLNADDENIVTVDNLNVFGKNYGKTVLTITYVDNNGKTTTDIKEVTVADGDSAVKIENVTFPDGNLEMPLNGVYDITLGINPPNGYVENKTFTSSNNNVVIVDEFGKVTAISKGDATITIDINNGMFKKELYVQVAKDAGISELVVNPTNIKINAAVTTLKEGDRTTLTHNVTPNNASNSVTWTSSDDSIATVDSQGIVTAIKEGTVVIKAATINGIEDSVTIVVEKNEVSVTDIELSITELTLTVGQVEKIVPVVVPTDATDKTLSYEAADTNILTINVNEDTSADITGLVEGTTIITIKSSNGIEKTLNVAVVGTRTPEPETPPSSGGSCGSCSSKKCEAGKYCSCGKCYSCPEGYYCANNKKTECPAGKSSIANSSSYQDCYACSKGYYLNNHKCTACPSGTTTKSSGATSKDECVADSSTITAPCCVTEKSGNKTTINDPSGCKQAAMGGASVVSGACPKVTSCSIGQYINSAGQCATCPKGSYCKDGKKLYDCPAGKGAATGAKYEVNCQLCGEGYISAKGKACTKCTSGKSNSSRTACIN